MKLRMDNLTWQEIDGELVILDLQGSTYLTTNATGAYLTKLLTEERSTSELADALMTEYQVDRQTAEQDVDAFVAQLTEQNLLA